MNQPSSTDPVATVRAFNRFYTRHIGVLEDGLLRSRFSLPQARLLWELAHQPQQTASTLARELRLDLGYLSRLLAELRERGLVKAAKHPADGRQTLLSLSAAGRRAFAPLDQTSHAQTADLLAPLGALAQQRLLRAMARVQRLLGDGDAAAQVSLRGGLLPGDLGWVIGRHGAVYAAEYGWDTRFELMAAQIAAQCVARFDSAREAAWIAERDGDRLGCVFLVQARDEVTEAVVPGVAQLRLLLVEPEARGLGLGRRLARACSDFARAQGYQRIRLWTNSALTAARAIYLSEGYRLLSSEHHHSFGHDLVGETWELDLNEKRD